MDSRDRQRNRWAEWLQIGLLQVALLLALVFGLSDKGHAYPGGLDGNGCHTNRKTGDYHCHRAPAAADASAANPASFVPSSAAPPRQAATGRRFANCAEARAAGVAPIRRGEPGYALHLDRDGDGIACEPYPRR